MHCRSRIYQSNTRIHQGIPVDAKRHEMKPLRIALVHLPGDSTGAALADDLRAKGHSITLITPDGGVNCRPLQADVLIIPANECSFPITTRGVGNNILKARSTYPGPLTSFEIFRTVTFPHVIESAVPILGIGAGALLLYDEVLRGQLDFAANGELIPVVDNTKAFFEATEPFYFKGDYKGTLIAGVENTPPMRQLLSILNELAPEGTQPSSPASPALVPVPILRTPPSLKNVDAKSK